MKWSDKDKHGKEWKNTYEPGSCLVGWEAEMKKIDEIEKYATMGLLGTTNPAGRLTLTWYPESFTKQAKITDMGMRPNPLTHNPQGRDHARIHGGYGC